MQRNELILIATDTFFPKKKDLASLLDLPRNLKYTEEDQKIALARAIEWLTKYNLYVPQIVDKKPPNNSWFTDPRNYNWPGIENTKKEPTPGVGKKTNFIGSLLNKESKTIEKILAGNIFNPKNTNHLWIMGLLNIIEDREPPKDALLYSLRTKKSVEAGWNRIKKNIEDGRLDIWDLTFFTSIISQYHHKRNPAEVRSNKGHSKSRRDTPRSIAALDNLTLSKTAIIHILKWLHNTNLSTLKKEILVKGLLENFLLQAHLKPHLPKRGRSSSNTVQQKERCKEALHMINDTRQILEFAISKFSVIDLSPHHAKIENMTRHAKRSKDPSSDVELKLAESYPHFKVSYYLYESYRGEQRDKWRDWMEEAHQLLKDDAEGLVMYGPLLDSRRQQIEKALA